MVVVLVAQLVLELKQKKQKPWGTEQEQLSSDLYLLLQGRLKMQKLPPGQKRINVFNSHHWTETPEDMFTGVDTLNGSPQ